MNAHGVCNPALARKCAPARARYGTAAAAVPDQLARVRDDDAWIVLGGLNRGYEVESAARGVGYLTDYTVGEDAEVLVLFTEEEDGAGGGEEVCRGENWDMGIGGGGRKGKAGEAERGEETCL